MEQIIPFAFLSLFPFGQIIKIGIVNPIDVIAFFGGLYAVFQKYRKPPVFKYFDVFLLFAIFSWIFSIFIFPEYRVLYGLLYLIRLAAYFYFFLFLFHFARKNSKLLVGSLISVSVASAVFGWIQFFWIPDIKPFFTWGWDEHLFRLVGTFLDPTFLGLIIVFGLSMMIHRCIIIPRKRYFAIILFLLISLAFTYSRASYLAFAGAVISIGFFEKKIIKLIPLIIGLFIVVLLLPTARNHSIELFRSFSAVARVENYSETLKVFKTSPVFGIGFNNLCLARNKFIGPESYSSHACSGSDSSLLLVLATTGVAGFFAFGRLIYEFWKCSSVMFKAVLIALFIHSLFSNSLFYPWVLGFVLILKAVDLRGKVEG